MKQSIIIFLTTIFFLGCYDSDQKKPSLISNVIEEQKTNTQIELERIKAEKEIKIATIKKEETTEVATIKKEEKIETTRLQEQNKEKELELRKDVHKEDIAFKEKVFIFAIFVVALLIGLLIYLFHRSREIKLQIQREKLSNEQHMNELNMKKDMVIALINKIDPNDKESYQKLITTISDVKPEAPKLGNDPRVEQKPEPQNPTNEIKEDKKPEADSPSEIVDVEDEPEPQKPINHVIVEEKVEIIKPINKDDRT